MDWGSFALGFVSGALVCALAAFLAFCWFLNKMWSGWG